MAITAFLLGIQEMCENQAGNFTCCVAGRTQLTGIFWSCAENRNDTSLSSNQSQKKNLTLILT